MGSAWRIARKDLKLRLRDRSAIVIGVVVPLILAYVFNVVFGGAFGGDPIVSIGFADADRGQVAQSLGDLLTAIEDRGTIDLVTADDEAALRGLVSDGEVAAGLAVPAGLSQAAIAGEPAEVVVIGDVDSPTAAAIARGIAAGFAASVADSQRAVGGAIALGEADPDRFAQIATAAATADPVAELSGFEAADELLDPATFFAASMAAFFVFFIVQFGVTGLLDEEREGTLTRLRAAPIPRSSVVMGKAITSFILGVLSLTILAAATTVLMGAEWGNPVGVLILIVAVVVAATSILGVVAAVTRTPEGAGNLSSVIAVALGMLGGTFFPVAGGNAVIEALSLATPHSWFLRGLGALHGETGLGSIVPAVGGLAAFGLGIGVIAALLLRRRYA